MTIAVLGSGTERSAVIDSLVAAGLAPSFVGPAPDTRDIAVVADHREAIAAGAQLLMLVSYAPLIEAAFLGAPPILNLHCALLPRFRGFHGLIWSIINGEPQVGFTLHVVDAGIDSGPIVHQYRSPLGADETIHDVRARLEQAMRSEVGAAVCRFLDGVPPVPQDDSAATIVARRRPEDGRIDWSRSARAVHDLVRAITPPLYPGAYTMWRDAPLIVRRTTRLPNPPFFATAGRVVDFRGDAALVMCGDRLLQIDEVEYGGVVQAPRTLFRTVGARFA